ncbi:hypothetical protein BsWGS_17937 [Bradybaena similaris]
MSWFAIVLPIFLLFATSAFSKQGKLLEHAKHAKNSALNKYKRDVCSSDEFSCPEKCVPESYVCDTISDCLNSFDERNCTDCLGPNQFKCANGRCIPRSYHCDIDNDCGDNSDEIGCTPASCSPSRFSCANGNCVNNLWVCDDDNDCGDNSDEANCPERTCSVSQFTCTNKRCIPGSYQCDGDNDCGDHSDETTCTCDANHFQCKTGTCLSNSYVCDGENDCGDMSDESHCPEIHPGACADLLTIDDCIRMNTTTYPICDNYADAHRFCRKYCDLCNT